MKTTEICGIIYDAMSSYAAPCRIVRFSRSIKDVSSFEEASDSRHAFQIAKRHRSRPFAQPWQLDYSFGF